MDQLRALCARKIGIRRRAEEGIIDDHVIGLLVSLQVGAALSYHEAKMVFTPLLLQLPFQLIHEEVLACDLRHLRVQLDDIHGDLRMAHEQVLGIGTAATSDHEGPPDDERLSVTISRIAWKGPLRLEGSVKGTVVFHNRLIPSASQIGCGFIGPTDLQDADLLPFAIFNGAKARDAAAGPIDMEIQCVSYKSYKRYTQTLYDTLSSKRHHNAEGFHERTPMKVLTINAGSSSLKYQLINLHGKHGQVLVRGAVENIGLPDSVHKFDRGFGELTKHAHFNNHKDALEMVIMRLTEEERGPLGSLDEIDAIGHRVVSGGEYFNESVVIDDDVIEKIDLCSELAPLHNPPALAAILASEELIPNVPHVAVFDTAFFTSLPPRAYVYPLPYEYYEQYKIRKYGAHGISHRYVSRRAAAMLGADVRDIRLITCHLGSGASIAAVDHGVAVDTTMGLTPLDGLMMGTRCGTIDPAVVTHIQERLGYSAAEVNEIMNKHSGLLGVSGISSDMRAVEQAAVSGNERAVLACELYAYFIKRYIGQYFAVMGGADAIVFTAGVGENSAYMREQCLAGLEPMGIVLDQRKNRLREGERFINEDRSRVKIMVIPTNEELMIARDVERLVTAAK